MATSTSDGASKPGSQPGDWRSHCRRECLACIESLLEEDITSSQLVQAADVLSQDQYSDVVEERNIIGLCGYPLCQHKLGKVPTQRYRINVKKNQIIDITERKKFCSDGCYKSSQYFSHQLSSEPLWTRPPQSDEEKKVIKLLPHRSNHSTTVATSADTSDHTDHTDATSAESIDLTDHTDTTIESIDHTDYSDSTPDTADQHVSTPQSLSQERTIEECLSALVITEDVATSSRNVDAQSKETVGTNQDDTASPSGRVDRDVRGRELNAVEEKVTDSFTKISQAFSTWLAVPSSPYDNDDDSSAAVGGGVFLPAVHSFHGDKLQWNIFHRQMVGSLAKVCSQLKLDLAEAQESITNITRQFKLDRHSIMFRPSEWKIILLLLLIRCGMVDNVVIKQPVISEWMQSLHLTHSHIQQLLSTLTT